MPGAASYCDSFAATINQIAIDCCIVIVVEAVIASVETYARSVAGNNIVAYQRRAFIFHRDHIVVPVIVSSNPENAAAARNVVSGNGGGTSYDA